jgi:uncharacterized membrane protein HdeD (DUF308 family)
VPVRSNWYVAGALIVVGVIWIVQGLGIVGGSSFMTGVRVWAALGVALIVGGIALGIVTFRARSRS